MNEEVFLKELFEMRSAKHENAPLINERFKQAVLSFGSETEDNLSCIEKVGYGFSRNIYNNSVRGLMFRDSEIPLSEVFNYAEVSVVPDCVKQEFPELSDQEWQAALRLFVLILIAIEQ